MNKEKQKTTKNEILLITFQNYTLQFNILVFYFDYINCNVLNLKKTYDEVGFMLLMRMRRVRLM